MQGGAKCDMLRKHMLLTELWMPITIRNKSTEETIRRIGLRTGLGPSAVIAQAVDMLDKSTPPALPQEEIQRRRQALAAISRRIKARITDAERAEMSRIEEDMYDEAGLPR